MKYLLVFMALLQATIADGYEINPIPTCSQVDRVGHQNDVGNSTANWVRGMVNNDLCEGFTVEVPGIMQIGDFAFGAFELDDNQSEINAVDFSIELNNAFESLNLGEDILVAQLMSDANLIGSILLKKVSFDSSISLFNWQITVIWHGIDNNEHADVFVFQQNENIQINYVWDTAEGDQNPISFLALKGSEISINPYTTNTRTQGMSASYYDQVRMKATDVYLGILSSTQILRQKDRVSFKVTLNNYGTYLY